jgi:hypothetical protein
MQYMHSTEWNSAEWNTVIPAAGEHEIPGLRAGRAGQQLWRTGHCIGSLRFLSSTSQQRHGRPPPMYFIINLAAFKK